MNKNKKDILIGLLIFTLAIVLIYYLWQNNVLLTVAFLVVSAFVLLKWTNKEEKLVYLAGFILGTIFELILVSIGIWSYGNPTILGVPLWLPLVYSIGAVIFVKVGRAMAKLV